MHLDNSTPKAYLCNQGGTVSPFVSRLACPILSVTNKHSIALIPAYIPTHLIVESNYLFQGQLLLEWHLLPQMAQAAFHLWDLPEASSCTTRCQHYYTLEIPLPLGDFGFECLQPSLDVSHKLCASSSCISSSSSVQVSGRTCQQSYQMVDSGGAMLHGGFLASYSSQHVGRLSSALSLRKDLVMDVLVGHMLKGLPYLHLTLWLLRDMLQREGFSSSICQAVAGAT